MDSGNDEVTKLKALLQNEICLRKAAEEENKNLKLQLVKFSKAEVRF